MYVFKIITREHSERVRVTGITIMTLRNVSRSTHRVYNREGSE